MNAPELKFNEWNWSEKDNKWVYVELREGKKVYKYSVNPPKEFMKLNDQIIKLNKKLIHEEEYDKNIKLYKKMMDISKKMQSMRTDP
ncbi:MAG: hypothetical protein BAJALOKI1v1_610010 [Promethearchaeota archaeon]|nr:MAG: hypothetical protein BAJALOKI1v1_610010 [Candidatus Lokiarchaeota archaeon]